MVAIRLHATVGDDGEIRLRGLPLQRGQEAEVIVLAETGDEEPDDVLLSVLQHDPSWSWLRDPAEDLYSEEDVR